MLNLSKYEIFITLCNTVYIEGTIAQTMKMEHKNIPQNISTHT